MSASESESRFEGGGLEFHAKYMGSVEVAKSKGQEICQEAMQKLLVALKTRKEPKPRLIINLSFEGTRLKEMPPGINLLDLMFKHSQVSYVWKDPRDQRSLGIVRTEPDPEDSTKTVHRFHGIRTVKPAMPFLQEMQELFRIVKERSAQQKEERAASVSAGAESADTPVPSDSGEKQSAETKTEQPQDSRDRASSNLLGPDIPNAEAMPKNESIVSLDDLGDIFSSSATISQPATTASGTNVFNGAAAGNAFNPFGQPSMASLTAANPFSQQQVQPTAIGMSTGPGVMSYGFGQMPQYQQLPQQPQFPQQPFYQQQQQPQFPQQVQFSQRPQFPQQQPQFAPQFPQQQQQQYNQYQQQQQSSTNPFVTGGDFGFSVGGSNLFDRQNSVDSGDLLTPVSMNPTAATSAKPISVKPDAFSDLIVGLTPSSATDSSRQQLSSKELFKPTDKPKTTLRDLANQSPRP